MKKIYLIRHGLPAFPDGKKACIGSTDIPLSPDGLRQAEKAAEKLKNLSVTAVFSSPLLRAIQTAETFHRPVTVLDGLREMYAGDWDGMTFEQIKLQYPELYQAREKDKTIPLPNSESNESGLARFRKAMLVAARKSEGDFVVVAHGCIMGLFLQSLGGSRQKPGYAEIITLYTDNRQFYLQGENEHA